VYFGTNFKIAICMVVMALACRYSFLMGSAVAARHEAYEFNERLKAMQAQVFSQAQVAPEPEMGES
jgi:hypothetical protein